MFQGKLRRVGNSMVITVPQSEMSRLQLRESDTVMVDVAGVNMQVRLPFSDEVIREMRQVAEENREVLLLLKD